MLICGASFAGLAVARELAGSGARVLVVDRYEIGERQTSACAAPTEWLDAMGVGPIGAADVRRAGHPHAARHDAGCGCPGPSRPSTTRSSARSCSRSATPSSRRRRSRGGTAHHRSHGPGRRRRAARRRRARLAARPRDNGYQPPDAPLSRGLEVHPRGASDELEIWIDRDYVPAGYGWSFPARDEVRVGVGSFDPRFHVKEPTVRLARGPRPRRRPLPGQLDPPPAAPRDRGRGLLRRRLGRPLPAADRRGDPHRLLLRDRLRARAAAGRRGRRHPRRRCARYAPSRPRHEWHFKWMLRVQQLVPRVPPRLLAGALRGMSQRRVRRLVVRPLPADRPSPSPASARAAAAARRRSAEAAARRPEGLQSGEQQWGGRGPLADDQVGPGQQQHEPDHPGRGERRLLEAEDPGDRSPPRSSAGP